MFYTLFINYRRVGASFLFLLLCFNAIWTQFRLEQEAKFHLAVIVSLSGEYAKDGQSILQGAQLYVDEVNRQGGINGRKIELKAFDDQFNAAEAARQAEIIAQDPRFLGVIGHGDSGNSLSGATFYRQHGIVAISPAATNIAVTKDNPWYFRTIFNDRSQARFLAYYLKQVLGQKEINIVFHQEAYGRYIAQELANTAKSLGVSVKNYISLDTNSPTLDAHLKSIVKKIISPSNAEVMLLLSMYSGEGIKLIKLLRDAGYSKPMIAVDDFSSQNLRNGFSDYIQEQVQTGYYTNNLYVTIPLLLNTNKSEHFNNIYLKHYNEKPDWFSAFAYDSASLLVDAIRQTKISGDLNKSQEERERIRAYLASLNDNSRAMEGVTGINYFNDQGDAVKPVGMGQFKLGQIIPASTQLQMIRDIKQIPDLPMALKQERVLLLDNKYMYKTSLIYTGIKLNRISELNLTKQHCLLDFYLWFRYQDNKLPIEDIIFENTIDPIHLGKPVEISHDIDDAQHYVRYHIRGVFRTDFMPQHLSYNKHIVGVSFRHRHLSQHHLIYAADELGMSLHHKQSLLEDILRNQTLNTFTGWSPQQARIFADTAEKSTFGHPQYLGLSQGNLNYSRINLEVTFNSRHFPPRGGLSYNVALNLLFASLVGFVVLFLLRYFCQHPACHKWGWLIQTILSFSILLATESIFAHLLHQNLLTRYYLDILKQSFDILWWLVPAWLLVSAVNTFLWIPLEERTSRTIPHLVKNFVAFLIYLFAFFSILAFVYEQHITSLLATSGVLAMIVGLAIQLNLSNIFSGLALNLDRPFRIGDWVKIKDFTGKVVNITWRSTQIMTRNCILNLPNTLVSESPILNYNYPTNSYLIVLTIQVEPTHHPNKVENVLLGAVRACSVILFDIEPFVTFKGFNKWGAEYTIHCQVSNYKDNSSHMNTLWKAIFGALENAQIKPVTHNCKIAEPISI